MGWVIQSTSLSCLLCGRWILKNYSFDYNNSTNYFLPRDVSLDLFSIFFKFSHCEINLFQCSLVFAEVIQRKLWKNQGKECELLWDSQISTWYHAEGLQWGLKDHCYLCLGMEDFPTVWIIVVNLSHMCFLFQAKYKDSYVQNVLGHYIGSFEDPYQIHCMKVSAQNSDVSLGIIVVWASQGHYE